MAELRFLCTALLLNAIYLPVQSFLLIPLKVLELCPRQSSNNKNKQRAITPKLGNAELFLCTALLHNEIYLPTKFLVETSCSFKVMSQTRCGRMDGHTTIQRVYFRMSVCPTTFCPGHNSETMRGIDITTICSPFGKHKNIR